MFIGSINAHLRSIMAGLVPAWEGLPVYVGCSGNFTIERILASRGVREIHGNDVSMYSCAVGSHLAGLPFSACVKDERLGWLESFLAPGVPTIATLLISTSMLEFFGRQGAWYERMAKAYTNRFPSLHAATVKKIEKALSGVKLASFHGGDVMDFVRAAPTECVVAAFPPTYKSGYERLYKRLQAAFAWEEPAYELFTPERFADLVCEMMTKRFWVVSRDEPIEGLEEFKIGHVQTAMRSRPVHVYSNTKTGRTLTIARQDCEPVLIPRLSDAPALPMALTPITQGQLNMLRSEYLAAKIVPAPCMWRWGVLAGAKLIGAVGFTANYGARLATGDVYMTSDFAVHAAAELRLAKLVLTAVLSKEMKSLLEQAACTRVEKIATTAFTDKPVSMKYRGIFDLHSRKPGILNYVGTAGRWTLEGGYEWWQRKAGAKSPA